MVFIIDPEVNDAEAKKVIDLIGRLNSAFREDYPLTTFTHIGPVQKRVSTKGVSVRALTQELKQKGSHFVLIQTQNAQITLEVKGFTGVPSDFFKLLAGLSLKVEWLKKEYALQSA